MRMQAREKQLLSELRSDDVMKRQNYLKGFMDFESEFSHRWATWANNHMGWTKMKKSNRQTAKRREKRELIKRIKEERREDG